MKSRLIFWRVDRYDSELLTIADSHVAASVRGARRFEKANQKDGGGDSLERTRLCIRFPANRENNREYRKIGADRRLHRREIPRYSNGLAANSLRDLNREYNQASSAPGH